MVSVRFPKGEDGTVYGSIEAFLQEVNPYFVKLHKEAMTRKFYEGAHPPSVRVPEVKKTIALSLILYEEDDEKENRPRLVIDYSHWEPEI
jgi:hypothetical protein